MRYLLQSFVVMLFSSVACAESRIEVLHPNGGEEFQESSPRFTIRWKSEGVGDHVKIEARGGDTGGFFPIASKTGNDGEFEFKLPSSWGYIKFKIKVSSLDGRVSDVSDDFFYRRHRYPKRSVRNRDYLIRWHDRVVFLGDSNTYAGKFIAIIEASIREARVPRGVELINLGLSSETVSGLSEPAHPFPRPCVLDRLDAILEKAKPDVVIACYGTNDAIYYPLDESRFAKFKSGMQELITKVKAAGAKMVIVTPPPFDAKPLREAGKLRNASAKEFAWFAPYEDYNGVLKEYAKWERTLEDKVDLVVDFNWRMNALINVMRMREPQFVFAPDGVHFGKLGHRELARLLLRELELESRFPDSIEIELSLKRQTLLRDAWLTHVGHQRPDIKQGLPLKEAQTRANQLLISRETSGASVSRKNVCP